MKKLEIFECIIRRLIEDSVIDYQISYDITGRVYEAKALLFDLPEYAQRLALGENFEEKKQKIENFSKLFQLILPLGIVNQDTFLEKELANVNSNIKQYIDEHQIPKNKLHEYSERESLAYFVLHSIECPSLYPSSYDEVWSKVTNLIENLNGHINHQDLSTIGFWFGTHSPQFGFEIITLLIPLIDNPKILSIAYEQLQYFKDEHCIKYLTNAMDRGQDAEVLKGILSSLCRHKVTDVSIQTKLIDIYHSDIVLTERTKGYLMAVLSKFPNEQTFSVGLEMLKKNNEASVNAAVSLTNVGYPAEEIVELILPKIHATHPLKSKAAYRILCQDNFSGKLSISCKELLNYFVQTLEQGPSTSIVLSMPTIITNNQDEQTSYHIIEHLSSQNFNVLEGITHLISYLLYQPGIDSKPFTLLKTKKRYIELLEYKNEKIFKSTLRIIEKIGVEEDDRKLRVLSARAYEH